MIHESMYIKSNVKKEDPRVRFLTDSALCRAYQAGSREAIEKLMRRHMPFCISVARQYRFHPCDQEDVLQQVVFGAIHAAKMFSPNINAQYTTYAINWMKAFAKRYVDEHSRTIRLPGNKMLAFGRAMKTRKNGKEIEDKVEKFALEVFNETSTVPIDSTLRNSEHLTYADVIKGGDQRNEMRLDDELLRRHIADLPERQRRVIRMTYGIDSGECATLREIGDVMGITYERVRQIRDAGLENLRKVITKKEWAEA